MNKEYNIDNEFAKWMMKNWVIAGGLISQATASKILQRTTNRIGQMIKEGKIKNTFQYKNVTFVSYAEIMKILNGSKNHENNQSA